MILFALIARGALRGILAYHDVLLHLLQDNIFAGAKFLALAFSSENLFQDWMSGMDTASRQENA